MNKFILLWCFYYFLNGINAVAVNYLTSKEWNLFKTGFSKSYSSKIEEEYRYEIFLKNKRLVDSYNEKFRNGEVTYTMKLNDFSDLLFSEFLNMTTGSLTNYEKEMGEKNDAVVYYQAPMNFSAPSTKDWRAEGGVNPVKNQGSCGSCWAFSSTGAIEGQYFAKKGKLMKLSEQHLVDCTITYGNHGCNGGWMGIAFRYVKKYGIATSNSYPYKAVLNRCKTHFEKSEIRVTGYKEIPHKDEEALKTAVASEGPVSVAISVPNSFQFYNKGVHYNKNCGSTLGHAVTVVGYGTQNGEDYWLVKNSWGTSWGDKGYIKMARNRNNNCGIASSAIYPLV